MKSFKEHLVETAINEGVIKAPQKMKNQIENFMWQSFLKRNYDWMSKLKTYLNQEGGYQKLVDLGVNLSEKHLRDEIKNYTDLMKKYKVKDQKAGKKQDKITKSFTVDLSDLPKNYPPIAQGIPKQSVVKSVFNKADRASGGPWIAIDPKTGKGEMKIDMSQQTSLSEYNPLFVPSGIDTAKRAMAAMTTTLEHELMHLVQSYVLTPTDVRQGKTQYNMNRHSKKVSDLDSYYNSQVEFDPTIVSNTRHFQMIKDHLDRKGVKYNEKELLEVFVSAKPYKGDDPQFYVSQFFESLKRTDRSNWKKAIKKFTQLLKERGI